MFFSSRNTNSSWKLIFKVKICRYFSEEKLFSKIVFVKMFLSLAASGKSGGWHCALRDGTPGDEQYTRVGPQPACFALRRPRKLLQAGCLRGRNVSSLCRQLCKKWVSWENRGGFFLGVGNVKEWVSFLRKGEFA